MERMKAEEERRQLENKLQAEALCQQMEELKLREMEVSVSPHRHWGRLCTACSGEWALKLHCGQVPVAQACNPNYLGG
jgi:hypothetical protein